MVDPIASDGTDTATDSAVGAVIDAAVAAMERDGWVVLDGLVDEAAVDAAEAEIRHVLVDTPTGRVKFEGFDTKRVYALAGKTRAADPMLANPVVTGICERVLGPGFRVSSATSIAIGPGQAAQTLHFDAQVYPVPRPEPQLVVNSMWALSPFTEANGATRLVPGSHTWEAGRRPARDADKRVTEPTIAAEMPRGSVLVYLGSLWHGGGANTTDEVRIGLNLEYAAGWLRQQENQYLVVPPDRLADVPPEVLAVLGYSTSKPFLGYVDGRDPMRWLAQTGYRPDTEAGTGTDTEAGTGTEPGAGTDTEPGAGTGDGPGRDRGRVR